MNSEFVEISDTDALPTTPVITVHMLAFRHGKTIAKAIQSVVDQVVSVPFELLVAEDCSPDDTLATALDFQRRYPSIVRVLKGTTNVGMMSNVDRCLMQTRGDYIAVCEGDDYWCDTSKLQIQLDTFISRPECSMVFHAARVEDFATGRIVETYRRSLFSRIFSTEEIILGDGGLIPTASILVRRPATLNQPNWQREAPVGDYSLALRAATIGSIAYIDRVMSVYRTNVPHSWTSRHEPTISTRLEYAKRMESMLCAFSEDQGGRYQKEVRSVISKYFSDILVRVRASRSERQDIYSKYFSRMNGVDRFFARYSAATGQYPIGLKTMIRKVKTLTRLVRAHLYAPRIESVPGKLPRRTN